MNSTGAKQVKSTLLPLIYSLLVRQAVCIKLERNDEKYYYFTFFSSLFLNYLRRNKILSGELYRSISIGDSSLIVFLGTAEANGWEHPSG